MYILSIDPFFPPARTAIAKVVGWLSKCGYVAPAKTRFPQLAEYETDPFEIQIAGIYPRCEPELNAYYRFDQADRRLGNYALIFKHAVLSNLKWQMKRLTKLQELESSLSQSGSEIRGLRCDFIDLYRIAFGEPGVRMHHRPKATEGMFSALICISVLAFSAIFIAVRTRFHHSAPTLYPVGADLAFEGKQREFFKCITNKPDEIFFLCRNKDVLRGLEASERRRYAHGLPTDGAFSFASALRAAGMACRDTFTIGRCLYWLPSDLFFNVVKQVTKRLIFRSLFDRVRFNGFIARDEYNTDAITRTQELRRAGIRSIGIMHGLPAIPSIYPQFRYIDFDILYVFGKHQHTVYKDTWPKTMSVRPMGAFRLTRDQYGSRPDPNSKDIILFANQLVDSDAQIEIFRGIAKEFTDRKVILKIKYSRNFNKIANYHAPYMEKFDDLTDSIVVEYGDPYALMLKAGYVFGGLTTASAEFVQMGGIGFFVDAYDPSYSVFFRHFPEFCVNSTEEAINTIRAIESGERTYPREKLADLIATPKDVIFDVLRKDFKLSNNGSADTTEARDLDPVPVRH